MKKIFLLTTDEFINEIEKTLLDKKIKLDYLFINGENKKIVKNKICKKIQFINKHNIDQFNKFLEKIDDEILIISLFWNFIIPKKILKKRNLKIYNIHPSYIPYDKGKSPYLFNILKNNPQGITIHKVSNKIDSGKIFFRKKIKTHDYISGFELRNFLMINCILFLKEKIYFLINDKLNQIKVKKNINKINYSKDIDEKTQIYLKKRYIAKDLINIIRSRSGFKKGGAFFFDNKKKFTIEVKIHEKKDKE